ncbi:MAG: endonuclease V, partial [Thermoplasmata archaeon]|nr:endonuclease V [Thermoplasmata archaeon]
MRLMKLHSFDLDCKEAVWLQEKLRGMIVFDKFDRQPGLIAGADVAYERESDTLFGAVVLLKYPEIQAVEETTAGDRARFPYIPGLLSFREVPVLLKAFSKLKITPDLV